MKDYFENLNSALRNNNRKSLAYGDPIAWDNKKSKTMLSHMPRGRTYRRLEMIKWKKLNTDLKDTIAKLKSHIK